jgi:hypothetical protein
MAKCKSFLQIITSELEYGLHRANVATGELASAKAVSEGTASLSSSSKRFGHNLNWQQIVIG